MNDMTVTLQQVLRMARSSSAKIAHKIPGRIRIRLDDKLASDQIKVLVEDLKASADVSKVSVRGRSLVVEHSDDKEATTVIGKSLQKAFPDFERWSDDVDVAMAKYAGDPWINKTIPLGFVAFALWRGLQSGAFLAGESAFALAYVGFDLYWKFQQENVIKKIEQGMSRDDKASIED